MRLDFLDCNNFKEPICYHFLYLDYSYNDIGYWISLDEYKDKIFLELELLIFEETLIGIFSKFNIFDAYSISNFIDDNAYNLQKELRNEKTIINQLSEDEFREKYKLIFEAINDANDFTVNYNKENEFELVKNDINKIFDITIKFTLKALSERKSFTIVGI